MTAARLGELFGTDPLVILDSSDEDWIIRLACAQVINRDRKAQQEDMERRRG